MNINPILAQVSRGGIVESTHRGSYAVVMQSSPGGTGDLLAFKGDVKSPVFPRSAIKGLQAIPFVESGAVETYNLSPEEIAVACSSHNSEARHVAAVRSILQKAGIDEGKLACGNHWPLFAAAGRAMAQLEDTPTDIHNNCSGKHAGMLITAKLLGEPLEGYVEEDHPIQRRIQKLIGELCEFDLKSTPCGIDGCSVPTWAIPLENLALAFSKFSGMDDVLLDHARASKLLISAVQAEPFYVAGSKRFCTRIMAAVPRLFAKIGAEGVYCGCVPHAGIGIAVKCDDGSNRGAETIFAKAVSDLSVWTKEELNALEQFTHIVLKNRNGIAVGELQTCN